MRLDGATFLLQWAVGGLAFCWVTTRRREVGLGYGWLLRGVYGALALGAVRGFAAQEATTSRVVALVASALVVVAAVATTWVSVLRRGAGVSGGRAERSRRRARVAAMLSSADDPGPGDEPGARTAEFPPGLDLVAPAVGALGLLAAANLAGGPYPLAARAPARRCRLPRRDQRRDAPRPLVPRAARLAAGALQELTRWSAALWPLEVAVFLLPTGMWQVIDGTIDDGYGGLLGWIWIACAVTIACSSG